MDIPQAIREFRQLREDDKDFAEQWEDTEEDFKEWLEDVYSIKT